MVLQILQETIQEKTQKRYINIVTFTIDWDQKAGKVVRFKLLQKENRRKTFSKSFLRNRLL